MNRFEPLDDASVIFEGIMNHWDVDFGELLIFRYGRLEMINIDPRTFK